MKKLFLLAFITYSVLTFAQDGILKSISANEFANGIKKDTNSVLLDVRTKAEFELSHIEGAINIDFNNSNFYNNVEKQIDKSTPIYIYCRSGNRSMKAARIMISNGYKEIYDLNGGKIAWLNNNYEMVK